MDYEKDDLEKIYEILHECDPEVAEIVTRCWCDNPHEEDLERLREIVYEDADWFARAFNMTAGIEDQLLKKSFLFPINYEGFRARVVSLREEMGYDNAPGLERMLIDNLTTCWLRMQWAESIINDYLINEGDRKPDFNDLDKWLTSTQTRFQRASETLMKYKKFMSKLPPIQVNIASEKGQQVNVAGDVNTSGERQ